MELFRNSCWTWQDSPEPVLVRGSGFKADVPWDPLQHGWAHSVCGTEWTRAKRSASWPIIPRSRAAVSGTLRGQLLRVDPGKKTDMTCTLPRAKRISFTDARSVERKILAAHGGQTRRLRTTRNSRIVQKCINPERALPAGSSISDGSFLLRCAQQLEPCRDPFMCYAARFVPSKCFESSRLNHVTFHLFLPLPLCALFSPTLLSSLLALSSLFSSLRRHFLLRLFHIVLPPLHTRLLDCFVSSQLFFVMCCVVFVFCTVCHAQLLSTIWCWLFVAVIVSVSVCNVSEARAVRERGCTQAESSTENAANSPALA